MQIETKIKTLQKHLMEVAKTKKIGFVPTMGGLHKGHLSLIKRAQAENDFVVVSLFVNPTQFDNPKDLKNYPRDKQKDLNLLKQQKVGLVFLPHHRDLYPDGYQYKMIEKNLSQKLCGQNRPGHFTGVLTVVLKLFNLVKPQKAYFGEKDYQQLLLIKKMTQAFFLPIDIVACPTVRDQAGLALSTRNQRLSTTGLKKARSFAKILKDSENIQEIQKKLSSLGVEIDYIEDIMGRRFSAVRIENIRLIDNIKLQKTQENAGI